jgi:hypothetical protein
MEVRHALTRGLYKFFSVANSSIGFVPDRFQCHLPSDSAPSPWGEGWGEGISRLTNSNCHRPSTFRSLSLGRGLG